MLELSGMGEPLPNLRKPPIGVVGFPRPERAPPQPEEAYFMPERANSGLNPRPVGGGDDATP